MAEFIQNEEKKIIGTVTEIVYYNSVNGYAVCDIDETLADDTADAFMQPGNL